MYPSQEVEEAWAVSDTKEHIPLIKSSFSMTIKGIARCIFGKDLTDQDRVNQLTESYMTVWHELEVCEILYPCSLLALCV